MAEGIRILSLALILLNGTEAGILVRVSTSWSALHRILLGISDFERQVSNSDIVAIPLRSDAATSRKRKMGAG